MICTIEWTGRIRNWSELSDQNLADDKYTNLPASSALDGM